MSVIAKQLVQNHTCICFHSLLIWKRSSVFSWLSWPWHFSTLQFNYFVRSSSICLGLTFSHNQMQVTNLYRRSIIEVTLYFPLHCISLYTFWLALLEVLVTLIILLGGVYQASPLKSYSFSPLPVNKYWGRGVLLCNYVSIPSLIKLSIYLFIYVSKNGKRAKGNLFNISTVWASLPLNLCEQRLKRNCVNSSHTFPQVWTSNKKINI